MSDGMSSAPGGMPPLDSPDVSSMMDQMMTQGKAGQDPGQGQGQSGPALPGMSGGAQPPAQKQQPPRDIGTPLQEAQYLAGDVGQGLLELLPDFLQSILHVKPTDTPEEAAKKKQMLQRFNQLTDEDQQYVKEKFQKEQVKKQQEEEEEMRKDQEEKKKKEADSLPMPTGKHEGMDAVQDMNKKRQQLSSAG